MKHTIIFASILALCACGDKAADTAVSDNTGAEPISERIVDTRPSTDFAEALTRATKEIERAAELGHAWSTSDQLLADARAANEAGDMENATKLADEARTQAELAIIQAEREAIEWRNNIIGQ